MTIAIIVVTATLVIIAIVVVVGSALPIKHTAQVRASFSRRPEELWAILTDFPAYPLWRRGLQRVQPASTLGGTSGWKEINRKGDSITFETLESVTNTRLVRRIAGENLPFGGTWTIQLVRRDGGTEVSIVERGEVYNPVFRFVSRYLMGHHGALTGFLEDLGKRVGEKPAIARE